ncbi:MAG: dihydropteroate synthase [Candidatus Schekmanbacteria bacterium]|nr:MAG: dihydropteroate synthase [Candidatus Schekmanbacteria bacterium]
MNNFRIDFPRGISLCLDNSLAVMGVINCTPDSFYDGGKYSSADEAVERALRMEEEGAKIIDVGGESTRPGSKRVDAKEELSRVIPVVKKLRKKSKILISVDTYKSEVATAALDNGADLVNDISGFDFDAKMPETIAHFGCPVIIGHIKGKPETMQKGVKYRNVVNEVMKKLEDKTDMAVKSGIRKDLILIDPGIGFGKKVEDNLRIIKYLNQIKKLERPIVIGASRKSFIGKILDVEPEERLEGSLAVASIAALNGADIIRAHDVKETVRALKVVESILSA